MPSADEPNREVIRSENLSVVLRKIGMQCTNISQSVNNEHFYHQNVMAPVIPSLMKSHLFYIVS